jgi:glycosyltransferase involved in cell wall biosynthesis
MSAKLSVIIITFNEEKNIKACIESVEGLADEVLVLDSFSTDKTAEICADKAVRFEQHTFDGHVQQKNRAMNMASHDWVLSLDADERLSEELKRSIQIAKQEAFHWAKGFRVNRRNFYAGKWIRYGGWYPDAKIRLWDRRFGSWQGTNPHDRVDLIATAKEAPIFGDIMHYTFHSASEHLAQAGKFGRIGGQALKDRPFFWLFFKLILSPPWRWLKMYILKAGFLDGWRGLSIATITSYEVLLKYSIAIGLIKAEQK